LTTVHISIHCSSLPFSVWNFTSLRERLRSILMSVGLSVCMSVCPRGYIRNPRAIFTKIFVDVAYVRGSVLLWHADDRPYHLSAGRGWRECI